MEKNNYLKKGIGLIVLSFLGKVFGLLKQVIIAWIFGADNSTDVYFVADGAVAMIAVVASGAISVTLLSYYSKMLKQNRESKRAFIGNIISCGLIIASIMALTIVFLSKPLSKLLAPSFDVEKISQLSQYISILSIIIVLLISASICCAFLEGENCFYPIKSQNLFLSITTILSTVLLYSRFGISAIMYGYIAGFFLHYIFSLLLLNKKKLLCLAPPKPDLEIRRLFYMAGFVMIGNSAVEVNHVIDKTLASGLAEGSVSALYYGQIISTDIITAILVHSISSILLRDFSMNIEERNFDKLEKKVKTVIGIYFPLSILLVVIYYFYSKDFIYIILSHGNFNNNAAHLTHLVVIGYLACIITIPIKDIIMKIHYAMLDTKRPMFICIFESAINVLFSVVLSKKIGLLGISIGTSFASIISCIVLTISMKKHISSFHLFTRRETIIALASFVVVVVINFAITRVYMYQHLAFRVFFMFVISIVYISLLLLLKHRYIHDFLGQFKNGGLTKL